MSIFSLHPRSLPILSLGELWERFSYYGIQTVLVLYLTKALLFSDNQSYALYGGFAVFAFAMPVLGGLLADRLLGFRRAIIIGAILLIIGNIFLAIPNLHCFYLGLAIDVCGVGLYKPNALALLGTLYGKQHVQRENGFTWFYMSMNIGATLGPIVYGLMTQIFGWSFCFLFSAMTILITLGIFLNNRKHLTVDSEKNNGKNTLLFICGLIPAACMLISYLFSHPQLLNDLIIIAAGLALPVLLIVAIKHPALERNRIFALLITAAFAMCFFAASFQIGSSINLFIDRDINRTVWGWTVPTILFSSLYPLSVIVIAPLITPLWNYLAARNKNPAPQIKLLIGLLLATLAFGAFICATINNDPDSHFPVFWIVVGNILLGAGELCLTPATLAAVSRFSPHNLHSTMIGAWYFFVAIGGYLSGMLAKTSSEAATLLLTDKTLSMAVYRHTFTLIAFITLGITILLLLTLPLIKKLIAAPD
jgi:POT family proton-dependent oligopeptide transporter